MNTYYHWKDDVLWLEVYIKSNASKTEIIGPYQGCLKISLQAPAIDNRANEALCQFLAKIFAVPASFIQIKKGEHSKIKKLSIKQPKTLPSFITCNQSS